MRIRSTAKHEYSPLDTAHEALLKGQQAAQQAMEMGREVVEQRMGAATSWVTSYLKNQPLQALGIAAAVGALVALLIARR